MYEIYWFMKKSDGTIDISSNYLKECAKCHAFYYALWDRCRCGCKETVTNNEEIKNEHKM